MNLDAVRLYLALSVCGYHVAMLAGQPKPLWALRPDLAVTAFFILSGAVIFASLARGIKLREFYWRRARRIYPAYAFVVIVCAILLASSVRDALNYAIPNLLFLSYLAPTIPGAFDGGLVNASLWTLKIEVGFYLIAPLIAYAVKRWGLWVLVLAAAASALWSWTVPPPWGHQLPGKLHWFAIGGLLYHWFGLPKARWNTDLSFGLYIVHFPIAQALGDPALAVAASLLAAWLLWHLIERPSLGRKPANALVAA